MSSLFGASPSSDPAGGRRSVALALQGGGSHGAFTWGVLDRLLQDEGLDIVAVSGTSAGALNAGVLASGQARGGSEGARAALAAFWQDVGRSGAAFAPFAPAVQRGAGAPHFGFGRLPVNPWLAGFLRAFSPYQFNPLGLNPLRDLVRRHVDESALRDARLPLFITATHVESGQPRIFSGAALSVDALLASTCLPLLFHAVEIGGEPYWDGGYTGNPALFPLLGPGAPAADIVLVKINPLRRAGTPTRSPEIVDRLAEIGFNASLIAELRGLALLARLAREGAIVPGAWRDPRLHMIADEDGLGAYGAGSKLSTDEAFLQALFELGRDAADRWLVQHRAALGLRSTLDIEASFLSEPSPRPAASGSTAARSARSGWRGRLALLLERALHRRR